MLNKQMIGSVVIGALFGCALLGSQTVSAKSTAKVVYNHVLKGSGNRRNVNLTGRNGIYSKPGILKGARTIVSKSNAKRLRAANSDPDNFRAYRIIKTNRGSYYYKVVSFDQKVRGWVYGGRSRTGFYGGVTPFNTVQKTVTPSLKTDGKTTYQLPTSELSSSSNTFFFQEPQFTQYKVGRKKTADSKVITSTAAYKNIPFSLVGAVQATRSGKVWYQIASTNADIHHAWIPAAKLSAADVVKTSSANETANSNSNNNSNQTTTSNGSTGTTSIVPAGPTVGEASLAGRNAYLNGQSLNSNYSHDASIQVAYEQGYHEIQAAVMTAKQAASTDFKQGTNLNQSYSSDLAVQKAYTDMYNACSSARQQGIQDCTDGKLSNASNYSVDKMIQAAYQDGYDSIAAKNDIYQLGISFTVDGKDVSGQFWTALTKQQQDALVATAQKDRFPQTKTEITSDDVKKVLEDAGILSITFNGKKITFKDADPVAITPSTAVTNVAVTAHYVTASK
ncbi:hypothetical protein ACFQ22_05715 [Lentilactobacillus raoultii]|uniref:S-layer protein n=1 Tax=Lentilactobacillus raoultii TaxID=1987503 RepID=A0ABW3PF77_9LACO|nr:hypothetical protein [Lentilactobacillus raoultii]